ncbi:MAG: MOFRL family protein, partial [Bdellovibrionota bacterium]
KKLQDEKKAVGQKFSIHSELVGDGELALESVAASIGRRFVVNLGVLSCPLAEAIELHLQCLKEMPPGPFAIISGGECPVTITAKKPGKGGRNTHFTLTLAEKIFYKNIFGLSPQELESCWIASLATDGRDGNCPCAGACFNAKMLNTIMPQQFLENFDSYTFFQKMAPAHNSLLHFEEYQSNLMDVRIIFGSKIA